jgi:hypothetical protein
MNKQPISLRSRIGRAWFWILLKWIPIKNQTMLFIVTICTHVSVRSLTLAKTRIGGLPLIFHIILLVRWPFQLLIDKWCQHLENLIIHYRRSIHLRMGVAMAHNDMDEYTRLEKELADYDAYVEQQNIGYKIPTFGPVTQSPYRVENPPTDPNGHNLTHL